MGPEGAKYCGAVLFAIIIIGWPIGGGIAYGIKRGDEKNYMQTECLITNYTILPKVHNPGSINTALGQTYTTYTVSLIVLYSIIDSNSIESNSIEYSSHGTREAAIISAESRPVRN